jgi:hypothetical protein
LKDLNEIVGKELNDTPSLNKSDFGVIKETFGDNLLSLFSYNSIFEYM